MSKNFVFRQKERTYGIGRCIEPFERIVWKLYIDILRLTFSNVDPLETTKSF